MMKSMLSERVAPEPGAFALRDRGDAFPPAFASGAARSPLTQRRVASQIPVSLEFELPAALEAGEPPEARGLARDEVRLLVSYPVEDRVVHTQFRQIERFLEAGDLLVINTSGTRPAALDVVDAEGRALELHLSTQLPAGLWSVELRQPGEQGTRPFTGAKAGMALRLPGGATAMLHVPYRQEGEAAADASSRLWIATLHLPDLPDAYLERYGFPIRYGYVRQGWPLTYYQTVYATEPGSTEMPSAGRAFTPEVITRLVARGVEIAPLLLHTGVASLEDHEPPYEEFYRVPLETARRVNAARAAGRRVVAVGTTVVRALETVTDAAGTTHPGEGWTRLVITPERGLRAVNGLLTGLHEPRATHLAMLEALIRTQTLQPPEPHPGDGPQRRSRRAPAGGAHLRHVYSEALREKYLWHEFGDLHLLMPWGGREEGRGKREEKEGWEV